MTKLIITKQAVNAPARKLRGNWKLESAKEWFPDIPHKQALDNFWRDWSQNNPVGSPSRGTWGPELWEPWGFTLEDYTLKITDEQKYTLFVLRWS